MEANGGKMKTTVKNEIDLIEQVYTGHGIPKDTLARWLSDVDASVAREILLVDDYNTEYSYTAAPDVELLVSEAPWRRIYFLYLSAMIDFVLKQYNTYANELNEYNSALADYKHYIVTRYNPANKSAATREGYYISPYSIAVKHGFVGTEEEWIKSMIPAEASRMCRLTEPVTFDFEKNEEKVHFGVCGYVRCQGDVMYAHVTLDDRYPGSEISENIIVEHQINLPTTDITWCGDAVIGGYEGYNIYLKLTVSDGNVTLLLSTEQPTIMPCEATLTMVLLPELEKG